MKYLTLRGRNTMIVAGLLAATLLAAVRPAPAKEPVEQFLDALRRLEMHDMAVMYLDSLKTRSDLDPELKKLLPYEEGISLVAGSRNILDMKRRMENLDLASQRFEEFVKANPKHSRVPMANTQRGNVLVERAKVELEKSKKPLNADKKDQLIAEARRLFNEARKVFESADKQFEDAEKAFPRDIDKKTQYDLFQQREQVRRDFMQARLFAATVVYEASKAYPEGSEDWKKLLEESAKRYTAINERWRNRVAGLYALMWAGRSYQELGDRKKAIGLYLELLALMTGPGDDVINSLTAQTTVYYINCLIHKDEKKPNYEEALKRGEEWLKMVPKGFHGTADGLAVQWMMALCKKAQLDAIDASLKKETDPAAKRKLEGQKSTLIREIKRYANAVKQYDNQYRENAIKLFAEITGAGGTEGPPKTFADARTRAQEALESSEVFKKQASTEKDAKKKKELLEKMEADRTKAMDLFELAMRLRYSSDESIPVDYVNRIRYILCYLNYQRENYYEAAILGEYLAKNYPTITGARPSAKIAMVSYQQTYAASPGDDKQFDLDQIQRMASLIVKTWPEDPEADEALMTLADIHTRARHTDEAIKVLRQVKPDSPRRALADIKLGQALWAQYLRDSKTEATPEELGKMKKEAEEYLVKGVDAMRKTTSADSPPTYDLLTGEVYLTQLFIDTGRPQKAIELLERNPLGLLELVNKKYELTNYGNIRPETYKAGMRAYVSLNQVEKAEQMMNGLEKEYGKTKEDQEKLTRIYIALGHDLELQVKNKQESGNQAELDELLKNFELFLKRIGGRPGNSFATYNWIASTYYGLGEGMERNKIPTAHSKRYFDLAGAAYGKIESQMKSDQTMGSELGTKRAAFLKTLQVKIVECQRRSGHFDKALAALEAILTENAMTIDTQLEACYTLQQWGASLGATGNKDEGKAKYKAAMLGKRVRNEKTKRPEYVIWGWAHMAALLQKAMAKNPSFAKYFFESRYNLAYCRFKQAQLSTGTERKELLDKATTDILIVAKLYPDLAHEEGAPQRSDAGLSDRDKEIQQIAIEWQKQYGLLFRAVLKEADKPGSLASVLKEQAEAARARAAKVNK